MKSDKKLIISIIGFFIIFAFIWVMLGDSESEVVDETQTEKIEIIDEEAEIVPEGDDPISQVISEKQDNKVKIINDCLGTEIYSLNPEEILENISEGKISGKKITTIQRNFHGVSKTGEKYRFAYKRLEFEDKEVFKLVIVKEASDDSFESVDYNGNEKFEVVKSFYNIEKITLKEVTKTYSGNDLSLYFTQGKNTLRELTLAIKDKVVSCETASEKLNCQCRQ